MYYKRNWRIGGGAWARGFCRNSKTVGVAVAGFRVMAVSLNWAVEEWSWWTDSLTGLTRRAPRTRRNLAAWVMNASTPSQGVGKCGVGWPGAREELPLLRRRSGQWNYGGKEILNSIPSQNVKAIE